MEPELTWRDYLLVPLEETLLSAATYLPAVVGSLAILLVGWIGAQVARFLISRTLRAIRFEKLAERAGIRSVWEALRRIAPLPDLIARAVYVLLLFVVVVAALDALNIPATKRFLAGLLNFVPNVLGAALVLGFGLYGVAYLRGNLRPRAKASIVPQTRIAVDIVYGALMAVVIIAALGQLGVDTTLLEVVCSILVAGVVFAASLAFGLGGQKLAEQALADVVAARKAAAEDDPS